MSVRFHRWLRPLNVLIALGAAFLALSVYIAYKTHQPPGRPGKFAAMLDAHVQKGQPAGGPNGWDLLLAANATRMGVESSLWGDAKRQAEEGYPLDYASCYNGPVLDDRDDPEQQAHHVEQRRRALLTLEKLGEARLDEQLDAVANARRAFRPATTGPMLAQLLPEIGQCRATARMLAARMRRAAEAGDLAGRARAFEQLLAVGRVVGRQSALIDRLVGIACVALAVNRLTTDLVEFPLSVSPQGAAAAAQLKTIMDRQIAFRPMADALEGERFAILDTIELLFTDDGAGDGWLMMGRVGSFQNLDVDVLNKSMTEGARWMTAAGIFMPGKRDYIAKVESIFTRFRQSCDITRPERRKLPPLDAWIDAELSDRRYILLRMVVPAIEKALSTDEITRCQLAGTRLMLDIEQQRCALGHAPASLDALAAETGGTLPIDPVSGTSFGYRLVSPTEADPFHREYLLYSLGDDGIDDGGVQIADTKSSTRIQTLSKRASTSADYVINHADPPAPAPAPSPR